MRIGKDRRPIKLFQHHVCLGVRVIVLLFAAAHSALLAQEKSPSPPSQPSPPQGSQEQIVKKDDVAVYTALVLLQDNLPRGTRMTSGFRTADDQLRILRHFAQNEGIPIPPNMSVDKPDTWRPVLAAVQGRGYKIAAPGESNHGSDLIVFDLAGADLNQIQNACHAAQRRGVVKITKTILERKNNALHVELEVTTKGMYALGLQQPIAGEPDRTSALQLLQDARNKAKDDPAKQIDISYSMLGLLTNYSDQQALNADILKFQERIKEIELNSRKQAALEKIHQAKREGRLEDAAGLARQFKEDFPKEPESETIIAQYETPLLVEQGIDLYLKGDCESYQPAKEKIEEALKLSPSDKPALRILKYIGSAISDCNTRWIMRIVLGVLAGLGLLIGLIFLLRPGGGKLEGIDGACRGESFDFDPKLEEIMIGAIGHEDGGEADIVISDRKRKISREHCKIYRDGRKFFIKDMSANGTSINGQRLADGEVRRLKKNDEISLADAAILVFRRK